MRDDDRLLDLPEPEFGSGVIGVCDICGVRQAVIVLEKERFKLCVIDFLNKAWTGSDKKPGVPAPAYRSERVWFDTDSVPGHRAQGILLRPTKVVRHPVVLVTPDVYGLTTTVLDGAIRFAREGFEVFVPDLLKTDGIRPTVLLALRSGARLRGGVSLRSKRIVELLRLYRDALAYVRSGEMVDPARSAVFGTSYGGSLALALAAQDPKLAAVALAYPMPVRPPDLTELVTAPIFLVAGSGDRAAASARAQLAGRHAAAGSTLEVLELPGVGHHFLSRDLGSYDLARAEEAWSRLVGFLKARLMPPPPRPPAPPVKTVTLPPVAAPPTAPSAGPTPAVVGGPAPSGG